MNLATARDGLLRIEPRGNTLHVEDDVTGDFPGGQTSGVLDLTFDGDQIASVTADFA